MPQCNVPRQLAIVTGTTSGIGQAVARTLLDAGWAVVGVARRHAAFGRPEYRHVTADLADVRALASALEPAVARIVAESPWDRVGLVNNAASSDLLTSVERVDAEAMLDVFAVNTVAPVWLMGFVVRHAPGASIVRIVNVSSGAAASAFPGMAAYCSSKAALRMAGQVFAAELDSPLRNSSSPSDTAILGYQPGIVDTPMQVRARGADPASFPWVGMFRDFASRGLMVDAAEPAAEIVAFLESGPQPRIAERRLGG